MAHDVLKDYYLNGAIVYIDDTVIYGRDVKRFLGIVDHILSHMAKFNVRYFRMTSIEFLGYVFDINRVKLSNSKVK